MTAFQFGMMAGFFMGALVASFLIGLLLIWIAERGNTRR